MNRLTILKTSWGIAITYEINEQLEFSEDSVDIFEIAPLVFVKLNNNIIDDISFKYLKAGVESIIPHIKTFPITFSIEKLEYAICDYQPEGMYYMFRKRFFENHDMEVPSISVYYDRKKNKYIFPDLTIDQIFR